MQMVYIYLVENCFDCPNKVYVGKTKSSRKADHKRKFGYNIIYTVIDEITNVNWKIIESMWIHQFKAWGFDVQNKNDGGGGPLRRTDESIKNQIAKQVGKKHRKETCDKRSQSMKQIWSSRVNYVGYNKGKILSNETKQKMSKSSPKIRPYQYKPVLQFDLNNNLIKEHNSITEACFYVNKPNRQGDITLVCKGKQKTAFGYFWKYK